MNNLVLEDLLWLIESYNSKEVEIVKQAYIFADKLHAGQKRQSGEDYIIHPLNVAYNLALMKADTDTICAGLLHDVLEDTDTTDEEIITIFGKDVCELVKGVTKISNMHFDKQDDTLMENTRKIILSLKEDVRIIIIKLSDRLHNMQTLEFKKPEKRVKHAKETMEIFVPIAYHIGAYNLMEELEDLCLLYLEESTYYDIKTKRDLYRTLGKNIISNMINKISDNIVFYNKIFLHDLNLSGINKKLKRGYKFEEVHNIISLVICTNSIEDCYKTLGIVHSLYRPVNHKFKDYLCNPKTNMYKSLHTTVFGDNDILIQVQIRTCDMELMASMGLISYWESNSKNAKDLMKKDLIKNYQFFNDLLELDESLGDNYEFVNIVKGEILNNKVYCYTQKGDIIEMPIGSTIVDFAYKIHSEIGNKMVSAIVNDNPVDVDYVLKNKDRVKIITDSSLIDRTNWIEIAQTSYAKRQIKEGLKGDN